MTSDELLAPLNQLQSHTQKLLKLAEASRWDEFEALSAQREALLAQVNEGDFLVEVAKAGLEQPFREKVADIQALNDRITVLAETTKADIAAQLKEQNHQEKAVKAYKP
ncbi:flagellar protein FliT [Marinimicrobium locisalis]|uniref:flagellar protein FliT n=1 Tax=Marinimicrobium locisalis TaxID=546022 RepID=UPI0032220348